MHVCMCVYQEHARYTEKNLNTLGKYGILSI